MKRILLILMLPLFLSSCGSTYFYSTMSSLSQDIFQTENGDFIAENDSLLVAYWFNGENLPIFINVYNKSSEPLYVDWSRSSIIIDGKAINYRSQIMAVSDDNSMEYAVESRSFIPPMSRTTFQTRALSNFNYDNLKDQYFKNTKLPDKSGVPLKVQTLEFSKRTSPLSFKSFLSFYTYDPSSPFSMEHEFYISSLIKTKNISPYSMTKDLVTRGDLFYIEKVSKNRVFGGTLLGVTALVGLVAIEVIATPDNQDDDY